MKNPEKMTEIVEIELKVKKNCLWTQQKRVIENLITRIKERSPGELWAEVQIKIEKLCSKYKGNNQKVGKNSLMHAIFDYIDVFGELLPSAPNIFGAWELHGYIHEIKINNEHIIHVLKKDHVEILSVID